ncbi:hypothetical protein TEA_022003 [Camellia sinensis var. sinensis]|uniref:Agenet domain-containing protein n=1 Tax=Camellia sinensis var. sinensis TaxID=542762 RepID=A0A4S4DYF9_CAMSN|nr:hypothetical protein TEA_022003 [Camellia sinensis var. sinensis]
MTIQTSLDRNLKSPIRYSASLRCSAFDEIVLQKTILFPALEFGAENIVIVRYKKGRIVEVLSKNEVPSGSWHCAEIICGNGHNYTVRYEMGPAATDEAIVERVSRKSISPCPPPVKLSENCVPGDVAEVFQNFSWKMATVSKVLGRNCFLVRLLGSSHEFKVSKVDLRVRQSWQGGKWFPALEFGAENIVIVRYKKGRIVEVLSKNEVPSGSWHCAEIICGNGHNYTVRYEMGPAATDEAIVERVSRKSISPCPPPVKLSENCVPGDVAEVFQNFSWKMATVSKVLGRNCFLVRLLGSSHEFKVSKVDLRVRQSWQGGKWFMIGKSSAKIFFLFSAVLKFQQPFIALLFLQIVIKLTS